jgi:DNA-binding MarR family transcriptional regulator
MATSTLELVMHFRTYPLTRNPGRLIARAHMLMRAGLTEEFRAAGYRLSMEQWAILGALAGGDGLTQLELGARVGKNRHHLSRLLDQLQRQGLVARRAAPGDRRAHRVVLTAAGRAAWPRLTQTACAFLNAALVDLTRGELDGMSRALEQIIARLHAPAAAGGRHAGRGQGS